MGEHESNKKRAADVEIIDVYHDTLYQAFKQMRALVDEYPFIAFDTEFPGVCLRPNGSFMNPIDYMYKSLKVNSDVLRIIQVGFTFFNEKGESPSPCTWQFNFYFDTSRDTYAQDSIQLLTQSGIKFDDLYSRGIHSDEFCELLITSGIVMNPKITFISFQAGADFCYLVKMLTNLELPGNVRDFMALCKIFFPRFYDIKHLWSSVTHELRYLMGRGLEDLADHFKVARLGQQHQAGSDSYVTGHVFFSLTEKYFAKKLSDEKYLCHISGLVLNTHVVEHSISHQTSNMHPGLSATAASVAAEFNRSHSVAPSTATNATSSGTNVSTVAPLVQRSNSATTGSDSANIPAAIADVAAGDGSVSLNEKEEDDAGDDEVEE